ncbi:MAG: bifunctional DNA-formamidopyrimidine glycosylase/DNA-(apurinic or apyrimidinic site) lyase [Alphaproteobacteria bacterium]|nr:bifunctional DNA-formamidopyrimidine glycosylase/DNA-(apurinic or apyrimidinic site) lyase [Alphaproteobacteria bacterium]
MPELPEVETVCRGIEAMVVGTRIAEVQIRRSDLRLEIPANFGQMITGRTILSVKRRAKFILLGLEQERSIILHLGMSGSLTIRRPGDEPRTAAESKHDHVVWHLEGAGQAIAWDMFYNDPRRFGLIQLAETVPWEAHPVLSGLGLEPLSEDFSVQALSQMLEGKKTAIKQLLLDQRLIVGIGNIYAAEILYRAQISPLRAANSLQPAEIRKLHQAIGTVLEEAIQAGGSSLRNYVQASGELGYFQHHWAVYGRSGKPCPNCNCDGGVQQFVQNGRSSFWCPTRQS